MSDERARRAADGQNGFVLTTWDANAAFWNERMGEGHDFFHLLSAPAVD
jgi:hypothetical protein